MSWGCFANKSVMDLTVYTFAPTIKRTIIKSCKRRTESFPFILLKSSHYKLNIRSSVIGLWERPASRMFLWTNPQEVSKLKTNFLGLVGEVHITWATSLKRVNPCLQLEDTEEFSTFYSIRNQLTSFDSRPYRSYSSLNRGHRSISTFILAVHKVGIHSVYSSWKGGIDTPLTDSKT
jgi:hypothetical protein